MHNELVKYMHDDMSPTAVIQYLRSFQYSIIRLFSCGLMPHLNSTLVVDLCTNSGIRSHRMIPRATGLFKYLYLILFLLRRCTPSLLVSTKFATLLSQYIEHARCSALQSFKGCGLQWSANPSISNNGCSLLSMIQSALSSRV